MEVVESLVADSIDVENSNTKVSPLDTEKSKTGK